MSRRTRRGRTAFTLVEMLVVLVIVAVLATLVVALTPRVQEESRAGRGADQLQGWLLIAKQRAKSEGHPVGLRLQVPVLTTAGGPIPAGTSTATLGATSGVVPGTGILWSIQGQPQPQPLWSWLLVADDEKGQNAEKVQVQSVAGNTITTATPFQSAHPAGAPVRLLGFVTTLNYIEQPDDFAVVPGIDSVNSPQVRRLYIQGNLAFLEPWPTAPLPTAPLPDFSGGLAQVDQWPVQPGDYLEVFGGGQVHSIQAVSPFLVPNAQFPTAPPQQYVGLLQLVSPSSQGTVPPQTPISQYRIIRAPRLLRAEPDLQLPNSVAIDLSTNYTYGNVLPVDRLGNIDVLFSPSGAVVGRAPTGPSIILWVRDGTTDSLFDRQPTLVTTYIRTGFIAAHPVDVQSALGGGTPYTFTLDGRSSGL